MTKRELSGPAAGLILAGLKLSERELLRDRFLRPGGAPPWGGRRLSARENFLADILADPELAESCRPFFPEILEITAAGSGAEPEGLKFPPPLVIPPWGDRLPEGRADDPGLEAGRLSLQDLAGQEGLPPVLDFIGRALALTAGAALAGAAPLDERYLYTHSLDGRPIRRLETDDFKLEAGAITLPRRADRVLVLAFVRTPEIMGMNPGLSRLRPPVDWPGWPEGQIGAVLNISAWLKAQGYLALPAAGGLLLADHLGALAGLGELGRQGLLITPEYGPNLRLMTVITDFPFEIGRPASFGVADYCETCQRCINECPAKALTDGRRRPGLYQWPVNRRACFDNWLEKGDPCRKCIEICPYTREPLAGSPGGAQRPPQ